jgi:hypothetical protein
MVVVGTRGSAPRRRTKETTMERHTPEGTTPVGAGHEPIPHGIRASDAERERTVSQLNQHVVDGRLTEEEHSERIEAALAARTRDELDRLLVDLPGPPAPPAQGPPPPTGRGRGWRPPLFPAVALGVLAVALLAGSVGGWGGGYRGPGPFFPFFPLFPLLFWGFLLAVFAGLRRR